MALFKSIPAVSTQKDTLGPINRKPSTEIKEKDLAFKEPLSEEEEEKLLSKIVKPLPEEDIPDPVIDEDEPILDDEPKVAKEAKKEEKKPEVKKEATKAEAKKETKPEVKKETPKAEPKKEVNAIEAKEEVKVEETPKEVEETPLSKEEARRARMMANLEKARLARQAQQEKDGQNMAAEKKAVKKPAPKPKNTVDMSKMVMTTKKPSATTKTVYHVSKRGETLDDRVWKVFIQESDKVIKLFDYQEEALAFAKQLAKNKGDGSYVILHGLNGKIRKF